MPNLATGKAVISPARIPRHQHQRDDHIHRTGQTACDNIRIGHGDRCNRAEKAGQKTNRQVDMADDDHQGHPDRQHGDITSLVEQVAQFRDEIKRPLVVMVKITMIANKAIYMPYSRIFCRKIFFKFL